LKVHQEIQVGDAPTEVTKNRIHLNEHQRFKTIREAINKLKLNEFLDDSGLKC